MKLFTHEQIKFYLTSFRYSYGISDYVTFSAPLVFTFGLLNNNGRGHELAANIGLSGLGYDSISGFQLLPSTGFLYTYGGSGFRVQAGIDFGANYIIDPDFPMYSRDSIKSHLKSAHLLNDWLSIEMGIENTLSFPGSRFNTFASLNFDVYENMNLYLRVEKEIQTNNNSSPELILGVDLKF